MNLPLSLTALRLVLSPLFFVLFFLPQWTGSFHAGSTLLLWVLMAMIEISDAADGVLARSLNQVTDLGKLLDPFSDVISRLTYFICFAVAGIMPAWVLIIIFYREFSIGFLRMIMYRDGTALAARKGGKLKAIVYSLSGVAGMLVVTIERTGVPGDLLAPVNRVALVIFVVAALLCLASFVDYLVVFSASRRKTN